MQFLFWKLTLTFKRKSSSLLNKWNSKKANSSPSPPPGPYKQLSFLGILSEMIFNQEFFILLGHQCNKHEGRPTGWTPQNVLPTHFLLHYSKRGNLSEKVKPGNISEKATSVWMTAEQHARQKAIQHWMIVGCRSTSRHNKGADIICKVLWWDPLQS